MDSALARDTAPRRQPPTDYQWHRPETTVLYRTLQAHWQSFGSELQSLDPEAHIPAFVRAEVDAFLRCGILAHGFVRLRCADCRSGRLVAFSCKRRGFCPSCLGRRMSDTAAHLVDHVLPRVPVRQWVLTLPFSLRYRVAYDPGLQTFVLRAFIAAVTSWYRRQARRAGLSRGDQLTIGAVTAIQRFGSALNLNPHFHTLFLDGVYRQVFPGRPPVFCPLPSPTDDDIARIAASVCRKVARRLAASDADFDAVAAETPLFAHLAASSVEGRSLTGSRRGAKPIAIGRSDSPTAWVLGPLSAVYEGFNLNAAVRLTAGNRHALQRRERQMLR